MKKVRKQDGSVTLIGKNGIQGNLPSGRALGINNTDSLTLSSATDSPDDGVQQLTFPELAAMKKVMDGLVGRPTSSGTDPSLIVHEQRMQDLRSISMNQAALTNAILHELENGPEAAGWMKHAGTGLHRATWYSPETPSGFRSATWDVDEETQKEYVTSIHITFSEPDDDDGRCSMVYMDTNADGVLHNEKCSLNGNTTINGGHEWYWEGALVCRTEKHGSDVKVVSPTGKRLSLRTELRLKWILGFDLDK